MAYKYAGLWGPEDVRFSDGPAINVQVVVLNSENQLADLYLDHAKGNPAPNPIFTDALGNLSFYADPGEYTIVLDDSIRYKIAVPVHPLDAPNGTITEEDVDKIVDNKIKALPTSTEKVNEIVDEKLRTINPGISETKANEIVDEKLRTINPGISETKAKELITSEIDKLPKSPVSTEKVNEIVDEKLRTINPGISETKANEIVDEKLSKLGQGDNPFRWFDATKRYWTPVTYWWADQDQPGSKWETLFANADVVGFVIINPRSGAGDTKIQEFVNLTNKWREFGRPNVGYVRTIKATRTKEEILAEIQKYVDWYKVEGVFLDEMINGWSAEEAAKIPFYKDLYTEIKKRFGKGFLVVANPGTNTKADLLEAADILMRFEKAVDKYVNDTEAPVNPAHYASESPIRFMDTVHNVTEKNIDSVLAKAEKSNVGMIYITDDTFSGVEGSENENNNPWDSVPRGVILDKQLAFVRKVKYVAPVNTDNFATKKEIEDLKKTPVDPNIISDVVNRAVTEVIQTVAYVGPGDVTATLQQALDSERFYAVRLRGECHTTKALTLRKASGKEIGCLQAGILTINPAVFAGPAVIFAGGGDAVRKVTFRNFSLDMKCTKDSRSINGIQMSNVEECEVVECSLSNASASLLVVQGYDAKKTKRVRVRQNRLNAAGLIVPKTETSPATGFGILVQNSAEDVILNENIITNVSGGMGIGLNHNLKNTLEAPIRTLITNNNITMTESTVAFEPIGATRPCHATSVIGNILPISYDNGISIGEYSIVANNYIGEAYNHGVACSGIGTIIEGNQISNVGLENKKRLEPSRRPRSDWAAVAIYDPSGNIVRGNRYRKTIAESECDWMVKIHREPATPVTKLGGNVISGNLYDEGDVLQGAVKNANMNKARPDFVS